VADPRSAHASEAAYGQANPLHMGTSDRLTLGVGHAILPIIMALKYTPLALRICQFYWYGENHDQLAKRFSVTKSYVQSALSTPECRAILEELENRTLDTMLQVATTAQAIAPAIMEEKIRLALESPDDRVRATSCKDILEMAGHSPVKRIQLNRPDAAGAKHEGMSESELRDSLKKKVGIVNPGDLDKDRILN
jgi:hypothetical protein